MLSRSHIVFSSFLGIAILLTPSCGKSHDYLFVPLDADSVTVEQKAMFNATVRIDTISNPLPASFFETWKTASDEYAALGGSPMVDSVFQHVFMKYNYPLQYYVLPLSVHVRSYKMAFDVKTGHDSEFMRLKQKNCCAGEGEYIPHLKTNKPVLYLFNGVEKALYEYLGGTQDVTGIKRKNVEDVSQYMEVNYGHWGGYWNLVSMPEIYRIYFFYNGALIYLRDSWCSGFDVFVPYHSNEFIKISEWME